VDWAKAHFAPMDRDFYEGMKQLGLQDKIKLCTRPANSPDLSINNPGFFASLQQCCRCTCPSNELQLKTMATQSFDDPPVSKANRLWIAPQWMLNEIIKCQDNTTFKIPHMNKDKLEREGWLPRKLEVDPVARC